MLSVLDGRRELGQHASLLGWQMISEPFSKVTKQKPIANCSLSLSDLEAIAKLCIAKNVEAVRIEDNLVRSIGLDEESLRNHLENIIYKQQVLIFINGYAGESIHSSDPDIFRSHLFPDSVKNVAIESSINRKVSTGTDPNNSFRLEFEFAKNFSQVNASPHAAGQPQSYLRVEGTDEAWVVATFQVLETKLLSKNNWRGLLHSAGIYELLLFIVMLPLSIFLIDVVSKAFHEKLNELNIVARIGSLMYGFLAVIVFYRLFFNYTLWVFPSVELINENGASTAHRRFWWKVISGILVSGICLLVYGK